MQGGSVAASSFGAVKWFVEGEEEYTEYICTAFSTHAAVVSYARFFANAANESMERGCQKVEMA